MGNLDVNPHDFVPHYQVLCALLREDANQIASALHQPLLDLTLARSSIGGQLDSYRELHHERHCNEHTHMDSMLVMELVRASFAILSLRYGL